MKKLGSSILALITGAAAGAFCMGKLKETDIAVETANVNKFKQYYSILNQWLTLRQENITLEQYFTDNGFQKIAIYGMGELGNRLYDELKGTSIQIAYAIDSNTGGAESELPICIYGKEEHYPDVDAVIVTAVFAFGEIQNWLSQNVDCPIVSIEAVVFGV